MSAKQIDNMLLELDKLEHAPTVSYQLPSPPQENLTKTRSNQQLVRSLLYLAFLARRNKQTAANGARGEFFIDSLETITTLMDNLFVLTRFMGVGKNSAFIRKIGQSATKVWFVTLLFTIKKLITNIWNMVRLKWDIVKELEKCSKLDGKDINKQLSKIIIKRYENKIQEIKEDIILECLELFGTLNELAFVSIEMFNWKVSPTLEKVMGVLSTIMSLYRMLKRS